MTSLSSSLSSVELLSLRSRLPPSGVKHSTADAAVNNVVDVIDKRIISKPSEFIRVGSIGKFKQNGDGNTPPSTMYSSRRMSAMLKSPGVRKNIAESLGLNPNAPNIIELIKNRLSEGTKRGVDNNGVPSLRLESTSRPTLPAAVIHSASSVNDCQSRTEWAEPYDRKRYRSVDDVTADDSEGNQPDHLLRLLTVGAASPQSMMSRDHDDVLMRRRRSSLDNTGSSCPPPFRLPTYQEFVRAQRSRSRDDSTNNGDVISTCLNVLSERQHDTRKRGILSSLGGSYNDVRFSRCLDEKWLANSSNQTRSTAVVRREHGANRKLEIDSNGVATIFNKQGSSKRHQRPPAVNGVTKFPLDDAYPADSSISQSVQLTVLPNEVTTIPINVTMSTLERRKESRHQINTGNYGAFIGDGKTSCRHKPPAHPLSSGRPPKVPSAAGDLRQQPSHVSSNHPQLQQSTSIDTPQPLDYDHSIWDFLPLDSITNDVTSGVASAVQETPKSNRSSCVINNNNDVDSLDEVTCVDRRSVEQNEAVREIIETEISYGNDLAIIRNEFQTPLKNNGLLTAPQLDAIFLNLNQLMANNEFFLERLQSNTTYCSSSTVRVPATRVADNKLDNAKLHGPQSLISVRVGRAMLESRHMLIAFETYCVNQAAAVYLVDQLSQERELLRVFLEELPKDRVSLRKMDLKSFLMVPVQRVMKYPLLLDRLYKATPDGHPDKQEIHLARKFIEQTLSSINAKAIGSLKAKRRSSVALQMLLKRTAPVENVELTQFVFDILKWPRNDTYLPLISRLQCLTVSRQRRVKTASNNKYHIIHGVLATLGMSSYHGTVNVEQEHSIESMFPPTLAATHTKLKQSAVVLVKEKAGKFTLIQAEPLMLDKCIVSRDSLTGHSFQIDEMNGETYRLKADDARDTEAWYQQLRQLTMELGSWRRRRNALPNVLTHRRDDVT